MIQVELIALNAYRAPEDWRTFQASRNQQT